MTPEEMVARLVRRLRPVPQGDDRFVAEPGRGEGAVFGGFLLAQAILAAGATEARGHPHALHAHFVRAGRYGQPLAWRVLRVRDGWSFAMREVSAEQGGHLVLRATVSFTAQDAGLAHQDPPPAAPAPDGLPDWEDVRAGLLGDPSARRPDGPLEVRDAHPADAVPRVGAPARRALWMRPRAPLPDEPLLHAAFLAYASDRSLLGTAGRPHGLAWDARVGASLDHALWLHAPLRWDDWLLVTSESPVTSAGRGLVFGAFHRRDGVRVASVAQEGLLRAAARRARTS